MPQLVDELSTSNTTLKQREEIAAKLGIRLDFGPVADILARPLNEGFEADVQATLTPLANGELNDVAKLIKLRIFFETIMALDIANDPDRKPKVLRELANVQARLRQLVQAFDRGESIFAQFWEVDGEFHRIICIESGLSHLASVVDIVVRLCKRIGMPRQREDLEATLVEHDAIISGFASIHPSGDMMLEAVELHVCNALRRWFPSGTDLMDEESVTVEDVDLEEDYPDGIAESQLAFRRDLPMLLSKRRGQWVAYNRSRRLFFGRTKTATYQRCLKERIDPDEFIVRYVDVEVEECEYS